MSHDAKPNTVRALKRLERAAREAARALAQDRDEAKADLVAHLRELGIGFKDAQAEEGQSDE